MMKALVLTEVKKLVYIDVPTPEIGPEDVLVRVRACGICGSDVHGYNGSYSRRIPPIIMGHEASGEIVEVGKQVIGWQIGDRVTFDSTISCGKCAYCRKGLENLCDHRQILGVSCQEFRRDGAFAEYIALPQRILYRLPEKISFEQAALIEPASVAFHAVGISENHLNDSVVVIGAGMVGLLTIQTLRITGAGNIIAVDIDDRKLSLATAMGANHVINNRDENQYYRSLHSIVGAAGVDIAFEVVGLPQTVDLAVKSVRKGGAVTLIGTIAQQVEIPLQDVVTRQIRLQGSAASNGEYPACLEMIRQGRLNVASMISFTAPLQEGPQWFEKLDNPENSHWLKVVLKP